MEQQLEQLSKACSIAEASAIGLLKSHVSEYTRQDGTVVQAHDDSRIVHHKPTGRKSSGDKYTQSVHGKDHKYDTDQLGHGHILEHDNHDPDGKALLFTESDKGSRDNKQRYLAGHKKAVMEAAKHMAALDKKHPNLRRDNHTGWLGEITRHVKEKTGHDLTVRRPADFQKQDGEIRDLIAKK